ncbi:composite domain of metallo-dependent hydrolase [Trametes versicolor FP-101664 SS1]|uniref:composite domain of metallo-dependent hydrolase n=1 Tax=Trametes versicolor (strain FP-101664) TaxID=717944 RepID=UPI0004624809|nr:composite domain of metallo-dependent hydrolase [Trametes versicolor FP-101664 SS1]EIW61570.1 composite domain of metallo-dependent hydrolase [Trametes versicolor FP-101664 SS1]
MRALALCVVVAVLTLYASYVPLLSASSRDSQSAQRVPLAAQDILRQCANLRAVPGPPANFRERERSDRFELGTRPTLIKNATLWTGARNGSEIVYGDIFLDKGLVRGIGYIPEALYADRETDVVDARGGWVTPGIVDIHTHLGVISAPVTAGALDFSSAHGPIVPWMRSIDGFNTHDDAIALAVAGGVTSAQILPGSENVIGGQAFMVKLRKTSMRTPTSMLIEPPYTLNGSTPDPNLPARWRHLKQACGESPRAYGNRMDTMWSFRSAYAEARKVRDAQDAFCARAEAGLWNEIQGQSYPEDLRWEALVDVLRGRVKVSTHCYEPVDLDGIVRLTQEFKFPIASFHHAHEAYLVPDALKNTYGGIPTLALFADSSRFKREAYRGSKFAPRILADHGFPVAMKSDHPVLISRYLMFEAQQAHYHGLPPHLALASVTSVPAAAAGLSHRIGILREGADADVVLWDSHPLQLGATPRKVWIDGILQVGNDTDHIAVGPGKTAAEWQDPPEVPDFTAEREADVKWDGLAPLTSNRTVAGRVAFQNVKEVFLRQSGDSAGLVHHQAHEAAMTHVIVNRGRVSCVGPVCEGEGRNAEVRIDLRGGTIAPGMIAYGSALGIEEIQAEPSTGDGTRYDPLSRDVPKILGDVGAVVRVEDALIFQTRNALVAHRAGVTYATTSFSRSPVFLRDQFMGGLSATFRTGAPHALDRTAIIKPITALHVSIGRAPPISFAPSAASLSTEIATLRHLLLDGEDTRTQTGDWFKKAAEGAIPLVIEVSSADIMATLIRLKSEVEEKRGTYMRMVFSRATEAHLLAEEIAHARVGVILTPSRQFPWSWDDRRILAGPPLTNDTALATLIKHGVTVGLGTWEACHVPLTRFDVGWAILESNNWINKRQAYELVSTNLEKLLDLEGWIGDMGDLVAYEGGSALDFTSKPIAVVSPARQLVEIL